MQSENNIRNIDLFLDQDNIVAVINSAYSLHLKHNFDMPIEYFYKHVPPTMVNWTKKHNLDTFETLGSGINYYVEVLQYINRQFLRDYWDDFIAATPLRGDIPDVAMPFNEVQISKTDKYSDMDYCIKRKPLKDLMVEDYGKIDVWTSFDVSAANKNYRRRNALNLDQISRHTRQYDRKNATEGLRATVDNSSYTNHHLRGYGQAYQDYINNMTEDESRHLHL
jgi:hypothetical protein